MTGVVLLLVAWQIAAATAFRLSMATPIAAVNNLITNWSEIWFNLDTTLHEALLGWLVGNGTALVLMLLVAAVPVLERLVLRIAVVAYCLPVLAIGPILVVLLNPTDARVVIASLMVFFPTLVSALVGLRAAEPAAIDVVHAYGGSRLDELSRVRLRAALPSVFAGLRIAAPVSILGAIVGEYLGGTQGIGIAMITAQGALEVNLTWGLCLAAAFSAGAGYAITAWIGRALTSWAQTS